MGFDFPNSPTSGQIFGNYAWDGEKWTNQLLTAAAVAFLARTSGLDTTHTNAYTALIDGLVADGVWPKLDLLHVYATQDSTTALLNLVSTSFNGTAGGSPTFTADRGFTGVNNSGTVQINLNFNPTSGTPQYTQNSAHLSVWSATNTGQGAQAAIGDHFNQTSAVIPMFTDNQTYMAVNGGYITVVSASAQGHFLANRSSSSAQQGYKNGGSIINNTTSPSGAVDNMNMYTLGINFAGTFFGSNVQNAAVSLGSSLSSTDATNFYNRLRTYMTAVGVP